MVFGGKLSKAYFLASKTVHSFTSYTCRYFLPTTSQPIKNAKLSQQRFWHCYGNGLMKTIQTNPHNIYVGFKLAGTVDEDDEDPGTVD